MRIPELDGLRGIAILLVIGSHYHLFAQQLWTLPRFGWIGVDLFFALSGFLITSILLKLKGQEHPFRTFYARRARRILPPYLLFLLLLYGASVMLGDHTLLNLKSVLGKVFFLQAFAHPPHLAQPSPIHLPPNLPGAASGIHNSATVLWSLSIEEYFYLLWAPAVLLLSRKGIAILAAVICLYSLLVRWFGFVGFATYGSGFHRPDALIYGALTALLLASAIPRPTVRIVLLFAAGVSLAVLGITLATLWPVRGLEIRESRLFDDVGLAAVPILFASLLGLILLAKGHLVLAPLRWSLLRFFGQISYMLYLTHVFLYLIALHFFPLSWTLTFATLGTTVLFCWLSWKCVEEPILSGRLLPRFSGGMAPAHVAVRRP